MAAFSNLSIRYGKFSLCMAWNGPSPGALLDPPRALQDPFLDRILVDVGTTRRFPNPKLPDPTVVSIAHFVNSIWANFQLCMAWMGRYRNHQARLQTSAPHSIPGRAQLAQPSQPTHFTTPRAVLRHPSEFRVLSLCCQHFCIVSF